MTPVTWRGYSTVLSLNGIRGATSGKTRRTSILVVERGERQNALGGNEIGVKGSRYMCLLQTINEIVIYGLDNDGIAW